MHLESSIHPRVYSRRKGAEPAPADAVYVGRPTIWGNPFKVGRDGTHLVVVQRYRAWIENPDQTHLREAARRELRGKGLVCWCAPQPCHADVLLEIANGEEA